jgi:hypothetical protein
MADQIEPEWLMRMRQASVQRPRTQFQKVRWADIQALLREHALLLEGATWTPSGPSMRCGANRTR